MITGKFVSLGLYFQNGKRYTLIQQVIDDKLVGEPSIFSYDKRLKIFSIYEGEIEVKDDTICAYRKCKFVGIYQGEDRAMRLAEHDAAMTAWDATQQANKVRNGKTVILDELQGLRKAWQSTNATGRLALEVRVLNYLRNGRDL